MEEKEELQGYFHKVSPIKKSERVPYFDMYSNRVNYSEEFVFRLSSMTD